MTEFSPARGVWLGLAGFLLLILSADWLGWTMCVTGTGPRGFPHQKQAGIDGCANCSLDDAGADTSAYGKSCLPARMAVPQSGHSRWIFHWSTKSHFTDINKNFKCVINTRYIATKSIDGIHINCNGCEFFSADALLFNKDKQPAPLHRIAL